MILATIPPPPGNVIELGPLTIHYYGVAIAIGVLTAVTLVRRRYASFGGDPELADRIALWAVGAGLVGARIGYVLPRLDQFSSPLEMLAIWEGGLVFFGGLFAGTAMGIYLIRRWGGDLPAFADAVAPGIPLAQAFGRWGNYFNQELYGTSTTLPWALEIENAAGQVVDTVHPTFLYEMLGNLVMVAVLIALGRSGRVRRGSLMFAYGIGYGILRFAMEQIRTDARAFDIIFPANAWVALGVLLAGIAGLIWWNRRPEPAEADPADPPAEAAADPDAETETDAVGEPVAEDAEPPA
jgi:prolipoprotein diacylglyceryl transferase